MKKPQWFPDNFMLTLVGLLILASIVPVQGDLAIFLGYVTNIAIALLFFLHGAKLSTKTVVEGLSHWRLHSFVLTMTFLCFPLLVWSLQPLLRAVIGDELVQGFMYLALLPSTVQSAIALVSLARGNIPAAICGAATSSLLGIFITPLLAFFFLSAADVQMDFLQAISKIMLQLLLPFAVGQFARRWIGLWVDQKKHLLKHVDQSSIYLVVYTAFSKATIEGIWGQVPLVTLLVIIFFCILLLVTILVLCYWITGFMGFNTEDKITALFAASQKSLATGVPMAQVLFASTSIGFILLPLMLYHQVQLMVCAVIARKFQQRH